MSNPKPPNVQTNESLGDSTSAGGDKKIWWIVGGVAGGAAVLMMACCVCCGAAGLFSKAGSTNGSSNSPDAPSNSASDSGFGTSSSRNNYLGLTDEGYAAIKTGMTENEVEGIIGGETDVSEFQIGATVIKTANYGDLLGRYITVTYENGRVSSKFKNW